MKMWKCENGGKCGCFISNESGEMMNIHKLGYFKKQALYCHDFP